MGQWAPCTAAHMDFETPSPIGSASREWRDGLIDVGGNNRLLYYRNGATTLVLDSSPKPALRKLHAGEAVRPV